MKRNLFIKWSIGLVMFVICSCSNEMDKILNNEMSNRKMNEGGVMTRGYYPWEDEEETPLEWAETMNGTSLNTASMMYMYVGDDPEYKTTNNYWYCVLLDWGISWKDDLSDEIPGIFSRYVLQVQWQWTSSYYSDWFYIRMPNNKYGLVEIISNGIHEDIPAHAFPYGDGERQISVRIRLIDKDFIISSPIPGADSQYKYNSSLFSRWYEASNFYYNPWGYDENNSGNLNVDLNELGESELIVRVTLPEDTDRYSYGYEVYNHTIDYIQLCGKGSNYRGLANEGTGSNFSYQGIATKSGSSGEIEVIASRDNKITKETESITTFRRYSARESSVVIDISAGDFK